MPLQHGALAAAFGQIWQESQEFFDPDFGVQIAGGLALRGIEVSKAQAMSIAIAWAGAAFFARGVDVLLSPTVPCTAWPIGRLDPERIGGEPAAPRGHAVFTPFFNHVFCPAISIPVGAARNGLPVGLQIAGPRLSDRLVLRVATHIEALLARYT